ncbi:MAG: VWA domain-containing protein [Acidobacteria bacterium]|nr:VWA domain-containing protein [Acidobacteriota bacterium]MBI3425692.1 VWA domain-containing protein [Acidobacteriota bacterium]
MKRLILSASIFGVVLAIGWPVLHSRAQQKPVPKVQEVMNTTAVLVDIVVKDRRGRVVKDLSADDFEVLEDGVKQTVDGFERISRESGLVAEAKEKAAPKPANTTPVTVRDPNDKQMGATAMALVFDRLSPDARNRARQAALSYVGSVKELSAYTGVYSVNLSLSAIQSFTRDPQLVKLGIEKAGVRASASFTGGSAGNAQASLNKEAQALNAATSAANAASAAGAAGGAGAGAAGSAAGAAGVDAQFIEMNRRMTETYEALERNQQGFATVNSLMALVNSMATMPGRKAVVYFSEGIAIPPDVAQQFRSVVNAANRANVAIYAVDAAGLRTESTLSQTRDTVNAISARRQGQLASSGPIVGDALTKQLERNEDQLRGDPQSGLMALSQETGGTFIGNGNDIGEKLKEVDEDMNTYYLVSYTPSNGNFDGKFRKIEVKLKRGGLTVQARNGYYAVNTPGYVPVLYYETPALAILAKPNPPITFPVLTLGTNFPEATRPLRSVVEVQAPASAFTFVQDHDKKTFQTDFSIVVLIRDRERQVVGKLSRQYVLRGPLDKLESVKGSAIRFYKETELPPGRYELEAIAYDAPSEKASVRIGSLDVADPTETKLRMSSVAIIQRIATTQEKTENPFQVGESLLIPSLTGITHKALKQMLFYFVVYPARGAKAPAEFRLQITQNGKSFADLPLKLAAPDDKGRSAFASGIPIESLSPGGYALRITVKDEQTTLTRSTPFMIEP